MSYLNIESLIIKHKDKTLVNIALLLQNTTALIGQSGSGKSLTLKSILNLLPSNLQLQLKKDCDFTLDANSIGFIPQNPFTSLSPLTKIKNQFFCDETRKEEVLQLVGLQSWVLNRFPSQLSGGQLQRVVIAIALSTMPKLLLLDEPTTALDEQSKQTILNLLAQLQEQFNFLTLYVTHDINSIKNICKNIVIIKDGIIIEQGLTQEILKNPQHSYTKQLIASNFENRAFRT